MYSKLVALCAFVAVASAGLVPAPVHYSSAAAVSSQNIVRHDQHQANLAYAAPVAKLAVAAPAVYHAAPAVHNTAPTAAPVIYKQAAAPLLVKTPALSHSAHLYNAKRV
ncbi:larval/pupal cuticle protein H1C-like [Zerene cesonia]|uniref:larval/pupal cuticle protein H1C-like n=1 Tax=Zerene cesonia TaxID=33412 RepID=UPI0018E53BF7|nr:larval/pupal cuticle protein H1C-like [Zerene cesonia]